MRRQDARALADVAVTTPWHKQGKGKKSNLSQNDHIRPGWNLVRFRNTPPRANDSQHRKRETLATDDKELVKEQDDELGLDLIALLPVLGKRELPTSRSERMTRRSAYGASRRTTNVARVECPFILPLYKKCRYK